MLLEKKVINDKLKCIFLETSDENEIFVSFSFGTGYGNRLVSEDNSMFWVGSGSSNILLNMKRIEIQEVFPHLEIGSQIDLDTANINIKINKDEFTDVIQPLINIVFNPEVCQNKFQAHKETSSLMFENHKENIYFRSNLEIKEYASPNRLFKLDLISSDLKEVEQEDIVILNRTLFRAENTVMVVSGAINTPAIRKELEGSIIAVQIDSGSEKEVNHIYRTGQSEDKTIKKSTDNIDYSIGTLTIRNQKFDFSLEEEEVYLQILGRIIFGEDYVINVGEDVANIIYQGRSSVYFKNRILSTFWSKAKFDKNKVDLYQRLTYLKENDGEKFSITLGLYAVQNKDLFKIIQLSKTASYERFIQYIKEIKKSMTETKIIYQKMKGESDNGKRSIS